MEFQRLTGRPHQRKLWGGARRTVGLEPGAGVSRRLDRSDAGAERDRAGRRRVRPAARWSVGVTRDGKALNVAALATGRQRFPEIGVRAGSAPPRQDGGTGPVAGERGSSGSNSEGRLPKA